MCYVHFYGGKSQNHVIPTSLFHVKGDSVLSELPPHLMTTRPACLPISRPLGRQSLDGEDESRPAKLRATEPVPLSLRNHADSQAVPLVNGKALPRTPGMLRAQIAVRQDMLRQCHPEGQEAWRLNQQLADLERELHELESGLSAQAVALHA